MAGLAGLLPHTWEVASGLLQTLAWRNYHGHDHRHKLVSLDISPQTSLLSLLGAPLDPDTGCWSLLPTLYLFPLVPDWLSSYTFHFPKQVP